jgi:predicted urease superfamily metal-dependent hydrolase
VKIVQVKFGYVSIVVKLKTVESLRCILVCEPNHLVAVGETGRLHLWVMNSVWR